MVGATLAELRDEGLLAPAGQRRPRGGEGGGAALQPLPRRRHACSAPRCARPARSWASTRTFGLAFAKSQIAAGDRLPERRHGVPVAGRPRQGRSASRPPAASSSSASPSPPPPARPTHLEAARRPGRRRVVAKLGEADGRRRRRPDRSRQGRPRGQHARGGAAPAPTAPTSAPPPACTSVRCLTTAAAGAGRGQRHGRLGPPRAAGAAACRSTTAATTAARSTLRPARRRASHGAPAVDLTTHGSASVALPNPVHDRVGHRGPRRRAGGATSTSPRSARWS